MVPSGAGSTAVTAAHFTPGGSWPQSRMVRYGCGRSFRGAPAPACAATASASNSSLMNGGQSTAVAFLTSHAFDRRHARPHRVPPRAAEPAVRAGPEPGGPAVADGATQLESTPAEPAKTDRRWRRASSHRDEAAGPGAAIHRQSPDQSVEGVFAAHRRLRLPDDGPPRPRAARGLG